MFVPSQFAWLAGPLVAIGFVLVAAEWGPALLEALRSPAPPPPPAEPALFAAPAVSAPSPTSPTEAVLLAYRACAAAKIDDALPPLESAFKAASEATLAKRLAEAKGGALGKS